MNTHEKMPVKNRLLDVWYAFLLRLFTTKNPKPSYTIKTAVLIPNARGYFTPMPKGVAIHIKNSMTHFAVPTTKELHTEGQVAYNGADDVFFVRRDGKIRFYKCIGIDPLLEIDNVGFDTEAAKPSESFTEEA